MQGHLGKVLHHQKLSVLPLWTKSGYWHQGRRAWLLHLSSKCLPSIGSVFLLTIWVEFSWHGPQNRIQLPYNDCFSETSASNSFPLCAIQKAFYCLDYFNGLCRNLRVFLRLQEKTQLIMCLKHHPQQTPTGTLKVRDSLCCQGCSSPPF